MTREAQVPRIHVATPTDISAMMRLQQAAPTASQWSAKQYAALFSAQPIRVALVAEHANQLQGFVVASNVEDEWEIENIIVSNELRRHGLGSLLLSALLERVRAQQGNSVSLEVRESNIAARKFYEKWAFIQMGRRSRYYSAPVEDALIYRFLI